MNAQMDITLNIKKEANKEVQIKVSALNPKIIIMSFAMYLMWIIKDVTHVEADILKIMMENVKN